MPTDIIYNGRARLANQLYFCLNAFARGGNFRYRCPMWDMFDNLTRLGVDDTVMSAPDSLNMSQRMPGDWYFQFVGRDFSMSDAHSFIERFVIKSKAVKDALEWSLSVDQSKSCAIHVRRGDYLSESNKKFSVFDRGEYLRLACERVLARGVSHAYVFSDDTEGCRRDHGKFLSDNFEAVFYPSVSDPVEDLCRLATFRNKILWNSTFSYWSAFIGNVIHRDSEGLVVSPDRQFTGENPEWRREDPKWDIVDTVRMRFKSDIDDEPSKEPKYPFDALYIVTCRRHIKTGCVNVKRQLGLIGVGDIPVHTVISPTSRLIRSMYLGSVDLCKWCQEHSVPCAFGHYMAFKDAMRRGYGKVLILEDDALFENDLTHFRLKLSSIPGDCDIAMLDWVDGEAKKFTMEDHGDAWLNAADFPGGTYASSAAYIADRRALEALVRNHEALVSRTGHKSTLVPSDDALNTVNIAPHGLKSYLSHPPIARQDWKRSGRYGGGFDKMYMPVKCDGFDIRAFGRPR